MLSQISLKTKIATAVSILFLFSMVTIGFIAVDTFHTRSKEILFDQLDSLTNAIADDIDYKISTSQRSLIELAQVFPEELLKQPKTMQQFLDRAVGTKILFDRSLFIFSSTGVMLAESPFSSARIGKSYFFRDYIQETITSAKPFISSPFISSKEDRHTVLALTAPVFDKKGKLIAIIVGSLGLTEPQLLGKVAEAKIGKTGYFYLTTSDGIMILHPDRRKLLQPVPSRGTNLLLDRAIYEGFQGTAETMNSPDIPTITSFKRLKSTQWILSANYPQVEAYSPLKIFMQHFVISLSLSIAIVLMAVWYITNKLMQPLWQFTEQIKFATLNVESLKPIFLKKAGIEIRQLASAFNDYIASINRFRHMAQYDALTKLPNRSLFRDRLEQAITRAQRYHQSFALMFIDLDDFKIINDTLGHNAGDQLLKLFAKRLHNAVRASDTVARFAGDEFVVLSERIESLGDVEFIAQKIVHAMEPPFEVATEKFEKMAVSIGIAIGSESCCNADTLIQQADSAMYQAKQRGKNRYCLYESKQASVIKLKRS